MRVIVDGFDFGDLGRDRGIDLQLRARKWRERERQESSFMVLRFPGAIRVGLSRAKRRVQIARGRSLARERMHRALRQTVRAGAQP
jgi:hypothetical protein